MARLDEALLQTATRELAKRDPRLAALVDAYGAPPLWERAPGFPTLLHIILEQQVSLASAAAAFSRLKAQANPLTPERFIKFDDATLKAFGFSRQKTRYGRELARMVLSGALNLGEVAALDDDAARGALMAVPGIGRWTADIYLLMALGRPDIWPAGDLALEVAARSALGLATQPTRAELQLTAEAWRPWRAVAARILWQAYLSDRSHRRPRAMG